MEAVFFENVPWRGHPTRAFAWLGLPEHTDGPVPGMVLVHGGGGTAFAEWVRLWTGRGYAAIAMDTCGCLPQGAYSAWQRHPDGGPGGWGGFDQIDEPWTDQWSYHAVAAVLRAHSLLAAHPAVDAARIGLTGLSWGGYLTCIAAGVDPRFRLAMPVYGCGFLGEDSAWLPTFAEMGEARATRWLGYWDPAVYLPQATQPFLWVNGTNDFAYPVGSWQKSTRLPQGPATRCLRVGMPHGHGGAGENPVEIHAFANHHLQGGPALARIDRQEESAGALTVHFTADVPVLRAECHVTCDAGRWQDRQWSTVPAEITHSMGSAMAMLPPEATAGYLTLTDARGVMVSGECVIRVGSDG
jgi:dienelactone hydrolase